MCVVEFNLGTMSGNGECEPQSYPPTSISFWWTAALGEM